MLKNIIKIQTLYNLLNHKQRQELLRLISSQSLEQYLKVHNIKFKDGDIYAMSDSKRITVLREILEDDNIAFKKHSRQIRFMKTNIFKAIFGIIRKKLSQDKDIVSLYPEFFI